MKIRYQFVTGEAVEIEVPDDIGEVAIAIDKDIQKIDRRETRRHNSVEELAGKGRQFQDEDINIEEAVVKGEEQALLLKAMDQLLPQQRLLIQKVFLDGKSISEIARAEGVDESSVRERLNRVYKKLKNILNLTPRN
ncbi:MAG: sigma-70 family RNA polymerase sigma factor [Negativicutes bacterium]|nr:sigma-70 family RNA polymerase sigma factor [Negativicutes bacterium]